MPLPLGPLRGHAQRLLAMLPAANGLISAKHLGLMGAAMGTTALGVGLLMSGVFSTGPGKLNAQINSGQAAKALSVLEEKLASSPEDPALNLLAIKARLALCQQRNCVDESSGGALPPLLASLPRLAANVQAPVELEKDTTPLTLQDVYAAAMPGYESAATQPATVLALYAATPSGLKTLTARSLFQPALNLAHKGEDARAAAILQRLAKTSGLPITYTYAAGMLSGMLGGQASSRETNLIAMRSTGTPPLPASAAGLIPWALKSEAPTVPPAQVLASLPERVEALKLENSLNAAALPAMAQELVSTSLTPAAQLWASSTPGESQTVTLALQRTALMLDPNQPDLWATYLPALISATQVYASGSLAGLTGGAFTVKPGSISSASTPRIASLVLGAAKRVQSAPGVATPLLMFASKLNLSKQQDIELEKLSQAILLKAAEQGDVTSTVILAESLPGVAQNNRQSVVPLLVKFIRDKLREGNFTAATNTADLLTNTLQMDVEFAPLVLEEFTDDLKRRDVLKELNATSPTVLLMSQEDAALDLGPLFTFMQTYFENEPKVITAQLTTLVAEATGTYGQPNAMYRLGPSFPAETLPPEKQQEWLATALEQSLLVDNTLSAAELANLAARLGDVHPLLNLAPLIETALKRTTTLEEQRTLWQSATPRVKEVLRAIRPEFTALMQGIDALADGRLGEAAQNLAALETPQWRAEAQPFIEQFNEKLIALSGVYVPISSAPSFKTAAIILAPQGLQGGKLTTVSVTFISRLGTASEPDAKTLRTNAAVTSRFGLILPYNFDTRTLAISQQTVAQTPGGGTFNATFGTLRSLKLQTSEDSADTPSSVLTVTLADGKATPFVRTLLSPDDALRPDGAYALQTRTSTPVSTTQNILPPGTMLTLATENAFMKTPEGADTEAIEVMPLSGSVRHPASPTPINFTGYYEPATFTSTFTFSYPLPQSAQPAKATVRCQALAGPITCGAHNLNSARQAYAALISGLQTRESLATASATRSTLNSLATAHILASTAIRQPVVSSTLVSITTVSGTQVSPTQAPAKALPAEDDDVLPTQSVPVPSQKAATSTIPVATVTPTAPVSPTIPAAPSLLPKPAMVDDHEADTEEEDLTETPSVKKPSSTEPEPGAFINNSGGNKNKTSSPTTKL